MIKLLPEEQEISIIQMGDNRDEWDIAVTDEMWKRRLAKLGFVPYRVQGVTQWFKVPDSCIKVRKEPRSRELTAEQRQNIRLRLQPKQAK